MLRAKDIMTKNLITVKRQAPVLEAMKLMIENEVTGIPVVDDDMTLLGIITEKDVLRLFYADDEEKNKPVERFMSKPAVSYHEDETLQDICDFMMVNYFRRVPVITSKNKVVGIVSRPDVLKYILNRDKNSSDTVET
jgi:CBS domain-containing protein